MTFFKFSASSRALPTALTALLLTACATTPLSPFRVDGPPMAQLPLSLAGIDDRRGRFREIFCHTLELRGEALPDYRPCDQALTRVGEEPAGTGRPIASGPSRFGLVAVVVPGVGWDCFANWLDLQQSAARHLRRFGFDQLVLGGEGLSGSSRNAALLRDAILDLPGDSDRRNLVLIGYSKGAPDILEALVAYPEIRPRVAAVVSAAGAIGGSPLANDLQQSTLGLLRHWPGASCSAGDGEAVTSLRPQTRQRWLAQNPLPAGLAYYSLVTYPQPQRISSILEPSYRKLSAIDGRNDSQLLHHDQLIPGSSLLGYLNADHWAIAVPVGRSRPFVGNLFADRNDYPREALLEALLRLIEEDLASIE
jgi:hypothetical protein